MAERSAIEWCDSTFNPWIGCTRVSPACDDCYAARSTPARTLGIAWGTGEPRRRTVNSTWALPVKWEKAAEHFCECTGCGHRGDRRTWREDIRRSRPQAITCCPDESLVPARRRVFCASLGDVFDNEVPTEWRVDLLDLIRATPNLDWLILTKRVGNVLRLLREALDSLRGVSTPYAALIDWLQDWLDGTPPANVWLGATVINQAEADRDVPKLLATPAAVRFMSMEPLLGPVDLTSIEVMSGDAEIYPLTGTTECVNDEGEPIDDIPALDWVIVGGESGPKARPMHPDWARSLRDQCTAAGVAFLFKQWGEWRPICQGDSDWYDSLYVPRVKAGDGEDQGNLNEIYGRRCTVPQLILRAAGDHAEITQPMAFEAGAMAVQAFRVGKQAAGRLLDGVQHDGFPPSPAGARHDHGHHRHFLPGPPARGHHHPRCGRRLPPAAARD